MPAGNYEEGIERINLTGAANMPDQRDLRARQRERMRSKIIGCAVAIILVFVFYGGYWIQTLGRTDAAVKTANVASLIYAGDYEQALVVADDVVNSGHYQWYGHLYKIVSLIHLQRFKEADAEADKLASYYSSGLTMPRRFFKTFLLAKMLNNKYDEDLKGSLSDRYPPAIVKIIREVRELKNVCYPIVSAADIADLHSVPKAKGCFSWPNY